MTKRHFKNATVYMHALSLIYLLSHCSISSPFLLLLRLAHFSLFHHAKKNNKHKCLSLGLSLNNCMGSNRALPSAKVRFAHRTWGKIYSVFFPTALFHLTFYYCYDLPTSRFSATPKKITSLRLVIFFWWGQIDSNYRPHAYQACALTN